jgi:hypothetical protein
VELAAEEIFIVVLLLFLGSTISDPDERNVKFN